jgi:predicted ATPase
MTSGIGMWRSTGSTLFTPEHLLMLAIAYSDLSRFEDALRCIGEAVKAMEASQERWCEAEVHRVAGEVELKQPRPDVAKAEACFERSLAISRAQQTKSWELRATTSMARLRRDQAKRNEARELLSSVYNWFTEGFSTLDLRQAKALLDELA